MHQSSYTSSYFPPSYRASPAMVDPQQQQARELYYANSSTAAAAALGYTSAQFTRPPPPQPLSPSQRGVPPLSSPYHPTAVYNKNDGGDLAAVTTPAALPSRLQNSSSTTACGTHAHATAAFGRTAAGGAAWLPHPQQQSFSSVVYNTAIAGDVSGTDAAAAAAALVLDNGTGSVKVGWAGCSRPLLQLPACVGQQQQQQSGSRQQQQKQQQQHFGSFSLGRLHGEELLLAAKYFCLRAAVAGCALPHDLEILRDVWETAFTHKALSHNNSSISSSAAVAAATPPTAIILTEPLLSPTAVRQSLYELLFEDFCFQQVLVVPAQQVVPYAFRSPKSTVVYTSSNHQNHHQQPPIRSTTKNVKHSTQKRKATKESNKSRSNNYYWRQQHLTSCDDDTSSSSSQQRKPPKKLQGQKQQERNTKKSSAFLNCSNSDDRLTDCNSSRSDSSRCTDRSASSFCSLRRQSNCNNYTSGSRVPSLKKKKKKKKSFGQKHHALPCCSDDEEHSGSCSNSNRSSCFCYSSPYESSWSRSRSISGDGSNSSSSRRHPFRGSRRDDNCSCSDDGGGCRRGDCFLRGRGENESSSSSRPWGDEENRVGSGGSSEGPKRSRLSLSHNLTKEVATVPSKSGYHAAAAASRPRRFHQHCSTSTDCQKRDNDVSTTTTTTAETKSLATGAAETHSGAGAAAATSGLGADSRCSSSGDELFSERAVQSPSYAQQQQGRRRPAAFEVVGTQQACSKVSSRSSSGSGAEQLSAPVAAPAAEREYNVDLANEETKAVRRLRRRKRTQKRSLQRRQKKQPSDPKLQPYKNQHMQQQNTAKLSPGGTNRRHRESERAAETSVIEPELCGMVLDCGFSGITVMPYVALQPVETAVLRSSVGGGLLTTLLKNFCAFRSVNLDRNELLVQHMKERCCFVSKDYLAQLRCAQQEARGWNSSRCGSGGGFSAAALRRTHLYYEFELPDYYTATRSSLLDYFNSKTNAPIPSFSTKERQRQLPGGENAPTAAIVEGVDVSTTFIQQQQQCAEKSTAAAAQLKESNKTHAPERHFAALCTERIAIPEILFHPQDVGLSDCGVIELILRSIALLPREVQPFVCRQIFVVGGSCMFHNFRQRLLRELRSALPQHWEINIHMEEEADITVWRGASYCYADRSLFNLFAVTRQQFLESGSSSSSSNSRGGAVVTHAAKQQDEEFSLFD